MWYININRQVIDRNRKLGENRPPISYRKGKRGKAIYCHELGLPEGGVLVYDSQGTILPCGARVVIQCEEEPRVIR